MADVVTRFKIETTQFDSKLRDTAKALQGIARQASLGGKDFNGFGQKSIEAARALGTVASGATNTKDKLKDLVGSFNDAAKAYNSLTDEAKKGEFGQALSASLQKLQRDIKETKEEIYGLGDASRVKGGVGGLFSGMGDKMSGAIQVFAGNMMTKAAGAVAELGSEIFASVQQGVELAKQGEGIRIAFERLGRGDILDGLRQATHGTVTDIELMKAAVKFNDFNLPVEELGTMLAFAQQKAKDTGQSVDYMVDSIVTGLGRKSLMILDNLGLSATEVKEKMKETGDMTKAVGEIIREQMAKAGDYVETAADRAAQADVELKNSMEELGRTFQPLTDASDSLWNSIKVGALNALNTAVKPLIQALSEAGTLGQGARSSAGFNNLGGNSKVDRMIGRLGNGKTAGAYSIYQQQLGEFDKYINNKRFQIAAFGGDNSSVAQSAKAKLQTELDGALKMRAEYVKRAQELHNQVPSPFEPASISGGGSGGGGRSGGGKTTTVKTEEQLNSEEIQKLTQEYIKASDDRRKAIEGEIKTLQDRNAEIKRLMEAAQGKIAPDGSKKALSEELSKLQREGQLLSDPIDVELNDQAIKDVQDEIDRLNGKKVEVELAVDSRTPFEKLRDSLKIEIAEENMQVDTTTLQTLMKTAIQNGIDGLDPQFASLQEKMREGMNIPDSAWEDLQTQINEKLKELGVEPIKIDFKTGTIAKDGKDVAKEWNSAANAISSVGSAMQSIEDPSAKIVGTIAQAIATIALTYAQSLKGTFTPWDWIAGAASGMATMMSVISAIHSATGYSEGGMIKGNSYSGDLIPANGGMIGLNAGEVVLNRAQQNTLASELQGSGGGSDRYVPSFVSGEQIWIALNAYTKRTGRGEVVTWR
jgi:hypothetical protein